MIPQFRLMQDRIDRVNQVLREQITGMRVVRAFVREPEESARFGAANDELTDDVAAPPGRLMALMFPTVTIVLNVSSVAAIWLGANRISAGDLSVGALIAFLSYLAQILMAVMMATFMAVLVPRAAVCAERIQEVLDTESSVIAPAAPVTELRSRGVVELRDVGFAYPGADEPVLTGISLQSLAGQTTAIIGSTGAGKTTLLNLIPRLFDVTAGAVLVDGVDVRELEPELLWDRIGLVPQRPYLFSGTVASNLRYGKPDATDERDVGGARDRAGPRLRGGHAGRARRADRPGRHQRVRAASASAWPSPGPSCAGPRSTCSTTPSPPSTWPPTPGCGRRSSPTRPTPPSSSSPSGSRPSSPPTRSSCSRTGAPSASAPTTSCSRPAPPTPRSSPRSCRPEDAA